jgi:hypothetical protein
MLLFQLSLIILLLNIKSRVYENIYEVQNNIISNILKISFSMVINGTNNYIYQFKSKNIFFNYKKNDTYYNNTIYLYNPSTTILFDLSIYERNANIFNLDFNISDKIIINNEIIVKINFDLIKYFESYKDFSFDMLYKLKKIENAFEIYFGGLREIEMFNYLIYNEKSILYDNKTFYEYFKTNVLNNIINEMNKNLIFYPECDALYYFNKLYEYLYKKEFQIYVSCLRNYYYRGSIDNFIYESLTRENGTIKFIKVKYDVSYMESYFTYEEDITGSRGKGILELDYYGIDNDFKPFHPMIPETFQDNKRCLLDALIQIINKSNFTLG